MVKFSVVCLFLVIFSGLLIPSVTRCSSVLYVLCQRPRVSQVLSQSPHFNGEVIFCSPLGRYKKFSWLLVWYAHRFKAFHWTKLWKNVCICFQQKYIMSLCWYFWFKFRLYMIFTSSASYLYLLYPMWKSQISVTPV